MKNAFAGPNPLVLPIDTAHHLTGLRRQPHRPKHAYQPAAHPLLLLPAVIMLTGCAAAIQEPGFQGPDGVDMTRPMPEKWRGERTFSVNGCTETLTERGKISSLPDTTPPCEECGTIYEIRLRPDEVCGLPLDSPNYRALRRLPTGELEVLMMRAPTDGHWYVFDVVEALPDDDGITHRYEYQFGSFGDYKVQGQFTMDAP